MRDPNDFSNENKIKEAFSKMNINDFLFAVSSIVSEQGYEIYMEHGDNEMCKRYHDISNKLYDIAESTNDLNDY